MLSSISWEKRGAAPKGSFAGMNDGFLMQQGVSELLDSSLGLSRGVISRDALPDLLQGTAEGWQLLKETGPDRAVGHEEDQLEASPGQRLHVNLARKHGTTADGAIEELALANSSARSDERSVTQHCNPPYCAIGYSYTYRIDIFRSCGISRHTPSNGPYRADVSLMIAAYGEGTWGYRKSSTGYRSDAVANRG